MGTFNGGACAFRDSRGNNRLQRLPRGAPSSWESSVSCPRPPLAPPRAQPWLSPAALRRRCCAHGACARCWQSLLRPEPRCRRRRRAPRARSWTRWRMRPPRAPPMPRGRCSRWQRRFRRFSKMPPRRRPRSRRRHPPRWPAASSPPSSARVRGPERACSQLLMHRWSDATYSSVRADQPSGALLAPAIQRSLNTSAHPDACAACLSRADAPPVLDVPQVDAAAAMFGVNKTAVVDRLATDLAAAIAQSACCAAAQTVKTGSDVVARLLLRRRCGGHHPGGDAGHAGARCAQQHEPLCVPSCLLGSAPSLLTCLATQR